MTYFVDSEDEIPGLKRQLMQLEAAQKLQDEQQVKQLEDARQDLQTMKEELTAENALLGRYKLDFVTAFL
jgi:hypothetical protein